MRRNPAPDEEKFAELILYAVDKYVADKLRDDPTGGATGGATKIDKTLFFSEFAAVRSRGLPITGIEYQKLEHGPAPRRLVPIRQRLIEEGSASTEASTYFGRTVHRLVPQRRPNLSVFDEEELQIVDQVVDALWAKTAREVSDASHDEKDWQMVDDGETIPYSSAYLSTTFRPTEAVRHHAAELSRRLSTAI